jgi:hypothetical protein
LMTITVSKVWKVTETILLIIVSAVMTALLVIGTVLGGSAVLFFVVTVFISDAIVTLISQWQFWFALAGVAIGAMIFL